MYIICAVLPKQILIFAGPPPFSGSAFVENLTNSTTEITFVENRKSTLRCVTSGGSLSADIEILVNGRDLTRDFSTSQSTRLTGSRCMKAQLHTIERRNDDVIVGAKDDGSLIQCLAHVTGLPSNKATASLTVLRE